MEFTDKEAVKEIEKGIVKKNERKLNDRVTIVREWDDEISSLTMVRVDGFEGFVRPADFVKDGDIVVDLKPYAKNTVKRQNAYPEYKETYASSTLASERLHAACGGKWETTSMRPSQIVPPKDEMRPLPKDYVVERETEKAVMIRFSVLLMPLYCSWRHEDEVTIWLPKSSICGDEVDVWMWGQKEMEIRDQLGFRYAVEDRYNIAYRK